MGLLADSDGENARRKSPLFPIIRDKVTKEKQEYAGLHEAGL